MVSEQAAQLASQHAMIAAQSERLAALGADTPAPARPVPASIAHDSGAAGRRSRRTILKLGGMAAAASAAALAASASELAHPGVAHAAGVPWQTGTVTADVLTHVVPMGGYTDVALLDVTVGSAAPAQVLTLANSAAIAAYDSTVGGAIGLYATSINGTAVTGIGDNAFGVQGISSNRTGVKGVSNSGTGVVGSSSTGVGAAFMSGPAAAQLLLAPAGGTGAPGSGMHSKGELYLDNAATVWVCIAGDGTTVGTWVRLTGVANGVPGGALNFLTHPIRIFDSRPGQPAPLPAVKAPVPANTVLSMQVTAPTAVGGLSVPVGATAVLANATAVSPSGPGFLSFWPNGQPFPGVSNLNYVGGQIVPNFVIVGLDASGKMAYEAGGGSSTDMIFDVAGYVL